MVGGLAELQPRFPGKTFNCASRKFGVRIEDLVFVTQGGCENLYRSSKELAVV